MLKEIDMPQKLIAHGASAQVSGKAREICNLSGCKIIELERNTRVPILPTERNGKIQILKKWL